MSKNILIISKYFPPELTGSSTYIYEIAHYLAIEGFKVEVLTTFPHFPNWKVDPFYKGQYFKKEIDDLIEVTRVYSYIPLKITIFTRILNELSFGFSSLMYAILKNKRYELVFCISPPPSVS
ncbi:MAG: hypothetical protein Q8K60_08630, partial [Parachlamydiaceae bacterium]|nr:hypothetical protein [Parachlamydiaceae bacterium]